MEKGEDRREEEEGGRGEEQRGGLRAVGGRRPAMATPFVFRFVLSLGVLLVLPVKARKGYIGTGAVMALVASQILIIVLRSSDDQTLRKKWQLE